MAMWPPLASQPVSSKWVILTQRFLMQVEFLALNALSSRSKYIDVWYHFIREHVSDGTFSTTWIPTEDMTADILTKPLPLPTFSKHRLSLGLVPTWLHSWWGCVIVLFHSTIFLLSPSVTWSLTSYIVTSLASSSLSCQPHPWHWACVFPIPTHIPTLTSM